MLTPAALESYMRRAAALTHQTVALPPFELFFDPHDPLRFFNYARPIAPIGAGDLRETLLMVRQEFAARRRTPRFEFVAEAAPELPAVLQAAGFVEESRNPLLVCTAETFRPAAAVPDLEIITLAADSPTADLRAATAVQRCAFGDADAPEITEAEEARQRARYRAGAAGFLARLSGEAVAAADFTAPLDGFVELVGIATLPAYRRRGIASALTARATAEAFARGARFVFLGAADERAGRVYERVGFRPCATALAYCAP